MVNRLSFNWQNKAGYLFCRISISIISRFFSILLMILTLSTINGCRKSDFLVDETSLSFKDFGQGTGTVTWGKNKTHLIDGLVFVNDGQTLTIEPGTVVRFRAGTGENASALVVARGGKIIAEGNVDEPIIFTAESDDLTSEYLPEAKGLWGGIIILGNAPVNLRSGEGYIEGIPLSEPRAYYGGPDYDDNSGILKYVSIRHGGTNIGEGNEINGLTLAGVGRKTEVDFVEVISNADDGIELFGGTVNLRHIVVSDCGDDAIDYDLGWSGYGQFWLAVQTDFHGDNIIEGSGGINPVDGIPNSLPIIFNTTLIGNGNTGAGYCVRFDRNAGGIIANSVIIHNQNGVSAESTNMTLDSYSQWQEGKLALISNLFYEINNPAIFELNGIYSPNQLSSWQSHFQNGQNNIGDPKINHVQGNYLPEQKLKGNLAPVPNTWFQNVDFRGAFGESNWIDGWTLLSKNS